MYCFDKVKISAQWKPVFFITNIAVHVFASRWASVAVLKLVGNLCTSMHVDWHIIVCFGCRINVLTTYASRLQYNA